MVAPPSDGTEFIVKLTLLVFNANIAFYFDPLKTIVKNFQKKLKLYAYRK